jgi:hypothetical protein
MSGYEPTRSLDERVSCMHRRPAQLCRYPSVGVRAARSSGVKLCKLWRLPAAPDHICPPPIELLFAGYRASSELVSLCRRRLMRLGKHVSSSSMHQTKPHMTQSEPRMPASQRRIGRPETHCNRSKASARRGRADSSTCRPKILVTVLTVLVHRDSTAAAILRLAHVLVGS